MRGELVSPADGRDAVLHTTRKDFFGPEVVLGMQVNHVRSSLAYYYMNDAIQGFSKGQVVAGVSITAALGGGSIVIH